ncbi:hypothetical protein TIFTF001_045845 [Ficus carica]|uniref:Uncharacterized protein n=1 Tax=Ficus carica TaxID=3494 RepID=A0AA87Z306_FICCA|nr:hypothetical protein TIFTF001_045845 [Ficus carica]
MQSQEEIQCPTLKEDRTKDVVVDLYSTAEARLELWTLMKVEARGFGSGSGEREPPVIGSLTRGWDRWYEVKIGTLEAGEGKGTSWLGIGQKRNSGGQISYAGTSIEASR